MTNTPAEKCWKWTLKPVKQPFTPVRYDKSITTIFLERRNKGNLLPEKYHESNSFIPLKHLITHFVLEAIFHLFYCYVIYFFNYNGVYNWQESSLRYIKTMSENVFKECKQYIITLFSSSEFNDSNGIIILKFNFSVYILFRFQSIPWLYQ